MHRGHNGHCLSIYMPKNSLMHTFDRSVTDITEERGQRFNLEYTLQEKITQKSRAQLLCNEPEKRIFIGLSSREGFGRHCQMLSLCARGGTACAHRLQVGSDGSATRTPFLPGNVIPESWNNTVQYGHNVLCSSQQSHNFVLSPAVTSSPPSLLQQIVHSWSSRLVRS